MTDDILHRLEKTGVAIPDMLLPRTADTRRWAVVACDQFTQDRAYWERAEAAAGTAPSALRFIYPEAFLGDTNRAERIDAIHHTMRHYIEDNVFADPLRGFMYLERDTPFNRGRKGLVAAIDLEQYDWSPTAHSLIRSTEGTVPERLPPRMDIRRNAPLEAPHILLLIDDDTDTLLPGLGEQAQKSPPVYSGELMMDSGSVRGWPLCSPSDWSLCAEGLESLARRAVTRYGVTGGRPLLFAVGDGNHSLAAAKGIWKEYKAREGASPNHPCRYALVEIENIYDPAIRFEPIHRVVFGLGLEETIRLLSTLPGFSGVSVNSREALCRRTAEPVSGNRCGLIAQNRYFLIETNAAGIATAHLQPLLDQAVENNTGHQLSIDYIHGTDELFRVAGSHAGDPVTGILLPPVQKSGFFETIARSGPLPRKSFSMGEACEKRFYIESRKLF